ncbi:IS1182 family transposase [Streptomyces cavernicola]|uniref:IS1182 family transposase n=1 Tax=Streptomyces cavernicola TaxID=3043613 RepID=A0ABT6SMV0_9ACTN|nr:IS1182 family transposase [Streptomyces sp. B-S-A6]MDI3409518.1 IS1182 family transposase [Streptomyces sp. B-S-A6]
MSMRPRPPCGVPAETARVARAAFPKGSLAIRIRDKLGAIFRDEDFSELFPRRGKPAWPPGQLALVLVLQFVEGLTDRQAAEAVRARIDWKYALGLELSDEGFDFSVLSEFRDRLAGADGGREVLDGILVAAREHGLISGGGRARTDSTRVLTAARALNWLEFVAETLRLALNAVARTAPDWLNDHAPDEWFQHYATRIDDSRFPKAATKRAPIGLRIGTDGMRLLRLIWAHEAPHELRLLPEVEVLRQVWVQQFHLVDGEVRRRRPEDHPPGKIRVINPYDLDARGGSKRGVTWDGYKVHLTETCGTPDAPHLITNVLTTTAPIADSRMSAPVHAGLARRGLLPDEHWVDAGYANAPAMARALDDWNVSLHGPLQQPTMTQSRNGNFYSQDDFTIDWDNKRATCPNGHVNSQWATDRSHEGQPVVRIAFAPANCRACPDRPRCVSPPNVRQRKLTLRPQATHQTLQQARVLQQTTDWKDRYKIRAGVEGTISQAAAHGLRRSRYQGLRKTGIHHQLIASAINLIRIDAWLTHRPRACTRTSPLTELRATR